MSDHTSAQILQNRLSYHGSKFSFHTDRIKLPNGAIGEYSYIKHPGAGMAVPVTADGKFVLVKQYRFAIQRYLLEFPAGTLEVGEHHDVTIKREIEEETGYSASKWQYLGGFYICPGYSDEIIHAYLAQDLTKLAHPPAQDEDEEIEVVLLSREEIANLLRSQSADTSLDAKSITAFHLALQALQD
ncbi:MAG: NUDIX hydrolase [Pseudanabaena sp.]|jgi:ADP-ribose pyrophosphatase|uniref:NUDIX hydrolase n=1 Tax=Pseudanabaena mucicola TaxID=71190 RepID=UPI0025786E08|nr:NUDIX hydrolase [Pseudanabaena mucicola]MCA6574925.1 NUDIX hydrolase [Pseudanabaena sp. M53BS1SP1A06MG]MCA6584544.1 NUDIX hydrolase [Pseudanabaena sp. M34BS1SP1A06MG]MCA6586254.1 NUDIX hydrolase [Pseudanabaena sp. M051S1SP1A06QC]MCA6588713.1 NUDIX hydrolase [Pseudanabaena sp. M109S1SP1A06QC]MCA6593291.1 NUDIX hydrolase [Pseudanabaena sp. M38BS1SP1A06MG]MCA6596168.1 NUDIX hydrolase [Pseudanabaena sp. M046S1SP1A06QC]MCA6599464.1 NUDIX hydrolase [Pseudanabaena sp. M57BS1SP1A06MG]MCA6605520.